MDKFDRNRCIINRCQTGPLTQGQIAPSLEISQGRMSQLYRQFQDAGEAGLIVTKATGAPPKLTTEQRAQLPDLFSKGAEYDGFEGRFGPELELGKLLNNIWGLVTKFPR